MLPLLAHPHPQHFTSYTPSPSSSLGSSPSGFSAVPATCLSPPHLRAFASARRQCWLLQDPQGPFASCPSETNPDAYIFSGICDLCLAGGSDRILCLALQKYTAVCQGANVTTGPWRNSSFCGESWLSRAGTHHTL